MAYYVNKDAYLDALHQHIAELEAGLEQAAPQTGTGNMSGALPIQFDPASLIMLNLIMACMMFACR
ncbi:hypothetical protein ULG90_16640 [Halopseudomonas pachastrellae]|nr:hypothetical protein ULG90_16640 [Halopseudomonas pachastrellae]